MYLALLHNIIYDIVNKIFTNLRFEAIQSRRKRKFTNFFTTRNNNVLSKLNNVGNPNKSIS